MRDERLEARFSRTVAEVGLAEGHRHLLVAVSGGLDSVVLLHLLRFKAARLQLRLTVAHYDHAMREESAADAEWLRGLCVAWGLPLISERSERPLRGETEAREARYRFLQRARIGAAADLIVTAHHADDQAETVLFRLLRGAGLEGVRGMSAVTSRGIARPLLPFWRRELAKYARRERIRWREDATNLSRGSARNRIRHELLPALERRSPGSARRTLVSLARLAAENERLWEPLVAAAERSTATPSGDAILLARQGLQGYSSALAARLLRRILKRFDVVLSRAGTAIAIQFISDAPSGRELQLPGGVRISLEHDVARLERAAPIPPDEPLEIPALAYGDALAGSLRLGGAEYRVLAARGSGAAEAIGARWEVTLPGSGLRFPLVLRARAAGDRVRTSGGSKTLKKLLIERRVPRSQRARLPILADATGAVVWFPGGEVPDPGTTPGDDALHLTIRDD